jgi:putative glutamine amidotransferase
MKVGCVTYAFYSYFQTFFPELKVITDRDTREKFDLIIFTGGEDISPDMYGQPNTHSSVNKARDSIERSIVEAYSTGNTKFLGICRGHQLLNVLYGGRLVQDIYFELGIHHPGKHNFEYRSSFLPETVNSMHHQGVINPGSNFKILAVYGGVIEATQYNNKVFSVQWHPEFMNDVAFFKLVKNWVEGNENLSNKENLNLSNYLKYLEGQYNKLRDSNPSSVPAPTSSTTRSPLVGSFTYSTSNVESNPEIRERIDTIRENYYIWVREQNSPVQSISFDASQ